MTQISGSVWASSTSAPLRRSARDLRPRQADVLRLQAAGGALDDPPRSERHAVGACRRQVAAHPRAEPAARAGSGRRARARAAATEVEALDLGQRAEDRASAASWTSCGRWIAGGGARISWRCGTPGSATPPRWSACPCETRIVVVLERAGRAHADVERDPEFRYHETGLDAPAGDARAGWRPPTLSSSKTAPSCIR